MVMFRLISATLLPVIVAAVFYQAEKKNRFARCSNNTKQYIIGITFGVLAIIATEFGIKVDGAVMNVRNAAPLTAGLIFGWPAGLIAGFVGGIQRWFSNAGDFTRTACSVATLISGIMGASVRRFMMDDKKTSWFYGLVVGITSEVLHMLMVFLTNSSGDIQRAFNVVQVVAIPMIVANGISVMLSIMVVSAMSKQGWRNKRKENISQTFQRLLLVCVMLAFIVTSVFTYSFQTQIADTATDLLLSTNIEDVKNDIRDASDHNLLNLTKNIASKLTKESTVEQLQRLKNESDVSEINIVGRDGIIAVSSDPDLIGFDMSSGKQAASFLALLDGKDEMVQNYQPISMDSSIYRKYAGVAIESGFLQVGYDTNHFHKQIRQQVEYAAQNRHIGQDGWIMIFDERGIIISDSKGNEGNNISLAVSLHDRDWTLEDWDIREGERFCANIYEEDVFCMYTQTEGYYIMGIITEAEAMFTRNAAVYMLAFMEVIVFAALFVFIFILIKKIIVENLQKVNASLGEITGGNLDVLVDVRDNEEFASLSDDINSTVSTLKHYIAEAAARIDKELEFAKQIQHSALPSIFPPYPNRRDFSIYAMMETAKEVGGDFYDFYLIGENRLAFLIADVSGKGIPAAMFMMTAKTLIKGYAESGMDVNDVFTRANGELCENNDAGMFVTAWMGILDLQTGVVSYANAGHNPPVIRRRNGRYEYLRERANFVLAGMEGIRYRKSEMRLNPGDEIYLYTDGVTEAQGDTEELFGEDRLLDSLNSPEAHGSKNICRKVKADVDAFVCGADQFDDITMISIVYNGQQNTGTIQVVPTMDTIESTAMQLEEELERLEVPMKHMNKANIVFDEVYSNIVRYSGAKSAEIRCSLEDGALVLRFKDDGTPYNPLDASEPDITLSAEEREIGGLGIFLVRKMMDAVEYANEDGCNILTLTLNLD